VDDIQVGNCRSGHFFSFERAGIVPDLVTLSKSISGLGMPMSLLLMRPQYDIFGPAEHNGTWRGNQLAFVGAKAGFEYYRDHHMEDVVAKKEAIIKEFMEKEILPIDSRLKVRGMGMVWGIDFAAIDANLSKEAMHACLDRGMIIERAGSFDCVLKLLPPLTIPEDHLKEGLQIIKESVKQVLGK
jgi:diaminobutyrate-2-oxoglutarate transaminase